ncbi:unnamed protein product, partial [Notodromas monacha]
MVPINLSSSDIFAGTELPENLSDIDLPKGDPVIPDEINFESMADECNEMTGLPDKKVSSSGGRGKQTSKTNIASPRACPSKLKVEINSNWNLSNVFVDVLDARMQGNKSEEYQPEPLVKTGEESRAALEAQAHVRQAQLTGKANQQQPIAMSCQCSNPACCLKMIKSQASLPKVGASTYVASVEPDRSECMIMTRDRGATPVQYNSRQSHVPTVIPPASSHHVREIMTMKASNTSQQRSRENSFFKLEKVGQQRSSDQHSGVEKQAFSMASPMSMTVRALGK